MMRNGKIYLLWPKELQNLVCQPEAIVGVADLFSCLATSKQEVMDLKRITEEREVMMIDHLQQVCLMNVIIVT